MQTIILPFDIDLYLPLLLHSCGLCGPLYDGLSVAIAVIYLLCYFLCGLPYAAERRLSIDY